MNQQDILDQHEIIKKRNRKLYLLIFGIVVFALTMQIQFALIGEDNKTVKVSNEINAEIYFNEGVFTIINSNFSSWIDVKFNVNSKFELEMASLTPGKYTVGAFQFSDEDGLRLNPNVYKVKTFLIEATMDGEKVRGIFNFK